MPTSSIRSCYKTETGQIDLARLKQDVPITTVAGLITKLVRSGTEMKGLCPLHEERTPSFYANDAKGVFYCHGCGRGGDVIAFVQQVGGRSFLESCEWLMGSSSFCPPEHRVTVAQATATRQANVHRAKTEFRRGVAVEGTVVETYLANRGLDGQVPGCIRHSWVPRFWRDDGSEGARHPAMIAAVQDVDGSVVGIQRTFLDNEGRKSRRGSPRLSLGQIRGGALRLGPARPEIMLTQGVEDGLALTRMFPGATVWSALGDGNLAHVALPRHVRCVILCGDADDAGRAAVRRARQAFEALGIVVKTLFPRAGKDFNEEWLLLHA